MMATRIAEPLGLFHVMSGVEDGAARTGKLFDRVEKEVIAGLRIDAGSWLIEEQDRRMICTKAHARLSRRFMPPE